MRTPEHIVAAAKRALDEGYTHYTPWLGLPALRRAIASKLERENGLVVDPDSEILVTTGAQEAVFVAMQMMLGPGDEVLIPDPHFTSYDAGVTLAGATVVPVPTYEADSWKLRIEELEKGVTPRTRAIVLVDPSTPSGSVLDPGTQQAVARLAIERDLVLVSDEVYEHFVFDGPPHVSSATLPGMRDRTISIWSLSKSYAMTGWRIGYMVAPADALEALADLKMDLTICAPALAQFAAIAALDGPQEQIAERRKEYPERARFLASRLTAMGLPAKAPAAGICLMANVTSTGMGSVEFCRMALDQARVHLLPGVQYGPNGEGYVRVSFLAGMPTLTEAMDRLEAWLKA